ncbi:MAG: hypothetical protein WDA27_08960 [Actinomycetota bacterium]
MSLQPRARASKILVGVLTLLAVVPVPKSSFAYPEAGSDSFDSSAMVFFTPVPGCPLAPDANNSLVQKVTLKGPTTVQRGAPETPPDGHETFETEIVELELSGTSPLGPVVIRQDDNRRTLGRVTQQDAGKDFPADSFFDVFVDVQIGPATYTNIDPVRMASKIYSLPPHAFAYLPPPGTCVPLALEGTTVPTLWMIHAEHLPLTTRDCVAVTNASLMLSQPGSTMSMTGKNDGPGSAQLIYGKAPQGSQTVDTELVAMSLTGTLHDERGGTIPFSIKEPPRTGSFGKLSGGGPDSFFDVFIEVQLGDQSFGVGHLPMRGSHNPQAGGKLTFQGQHPLGGWMLNRLDVDFGAPATCPAGSYPPA